MITRCILLALLVSCPTATLAQINCGGCGFCCPQGKIPTLAADRAAAAAVLLVHVVKEPQSDDRGGYYTDVMIDQIIKHHADLKVNQVIRLKRKLEKSEAKLLLFCELWRNKIEPFRAVDVPAKSKVITYLQGAFAIKDRTIAERLRYCFDFLNDPELEIANDALQEFGTAEYKDYKTMAKTLPAGKIVGWLKDPQTPPHRYKLYGSLLGHCGTVEHAKLLRTMIDREIRQNVGETDGLLLGFVLLERKEGWPFVQSILCDSKNDFLLRYSCVRVAEFLRDHRPDLVPSKDLNNTVALVLEQPEMADIGVDFLRKAKAWDRTDQILNLFGKNPDKTFYDVFIKRSVLRFALVSPQLRAISFVNDMRRRNADFVAAQEELLKSESR